MNLIEEFIKQSILYGENVDSGSDYRKGNKILDKFAKVEANLRKNNELDTILPLLSHENRWVKLHAAAVCLEIEEQKSLAVLKDIENNESGTIGMDAKYGAREWLSKK